MQKQGSPRAVRKVPLSRYRILRTALRLADERGLEAVTMRKVAEGLGVEAMSLYNHVGDKNDVLAGIVDLAFAEIDLGPPARNWRSAMRKSAISAHEALLRHPWACALALSPSLASAVPSRLAYIESVLARLKGAGFSGENAFHGYRALDGHLVGFTLFELGHVPPDDASNENNAALLAALPAGAYPHLAAHVERHLRAPGLDDEGEFEFGLDLILDGLAVLLDEAT